jgi:low temperature requirement protein LtrA
VWIPLAAGALVLVVGALLPDGLAVDLVPWILAAGLLIASVPVLTVGVRRVLADTRLHSGHLSERMGQLVMIVLGEAFVSLVLRVGGVSGIARPVFLVVTFIAVFAIWLLYFTTVLPSGVPTTPGRLRLWLGAHWLLMLGGGGMAAALAALTVNEGALRPDGTAQGQDAPLPLLYVMAALAVLALIAPSRPGAIRHLVACACLVPLVVFADLLPADVAWWATIASVAIIVVDAIVSVRRARAVSPAR